MNTKGLIIIFVIFLITVYVSVTDPLKLNPGGLDGTSAWVALYSVIGFALIYLVYRLDNKK